MSEGTETRASDDRRWLVVTGPSGSGKTTACLQLVEACRRRGLPIGGLVTPEKRTPNRAERWAHDVTGTGRRLIATRPAGGDGRWRLLPAGLRWGDRVLATTCPTTVLVVDEAGPAELESRAGWYHGMMVALSGRFALAVVTVRPSLLTTLVDAVAPALPEAPPVVQASGADGGALLDLMQIAETS